MMVRDFSWAADTRAGKFRKLVLVAREIELVMISLRLSVIISEPDPLLISWVRENGL